MTKIFTLFIHLACLTTIANAQIEKRSTIIGGQVYYYDSNIDFSTNQRNQKSRNPCDPCALREIKIKMWQRYFAGV